MKWLTFSEVVTDVTSKFEKIKTSDYKTQGKYKIIDQGKEPIAGYTDNINLVNNRLNPVVIFGDHTRIFKYEDQPIALGADGAKALWINPKVGVPQYVYYYLRSIKIKEAGYSRHFKFLKEVEIPIPFKDDSPDFDSQIRIAQLLGKVEGLIAQRKQHLQQLDDLVKSVFLEMFGDPVRNEKGWDTIPFNKIGKFVSGGTPSKNRDDFWRGSFPWVSPKDMKTEKIIDAIDHISESVFQETTLKRIAPNHLLIVVRGMILAHSFPVAINTVEISINQDMKAIKPNKGISVIYLQNCLIALKRQILKLISSAGHGTRKFDSVAMQKLLIPNPPQALQNQFAAIAEKIEALKSQYQQSLNDLESLYGALSQQAFKGELDLSRVPLPTEHTKQNAEEVETSTSVKINIPLSDGFHAPQAPNAAEVRTPEGRTTFLRIMLSAWLEQFSHRPFSLTDFMGNVQNKLWDLTDGELFLNTDDYDQIKSWLFDALKAEKLEQVYDDENNRVQLKPRSAKGKLA